MKFANTMNGFVKVGDDSEQSTIILYWSDGLDAFEGFAKIINVSGQWEWDISTP